MCGRDLYGRYHRLIDELARSAEPGADWQTALKEHIARFETDAAVLDTDEARLRREELCAQLEHEALHSTRPLARRILSAAVKWLELSGL
ncbi:MAG: hypothetical protein D6782_13205 [Alphaproteobacteria bacterium]|nr:MAG: hypothetical protein D6782_13205 [Alphaproteobacteria bacterium]